MFGDEDPSLLVRLAAASSRYQAWEDAMEASIAKDQSLRLVVLELGCGLRVPSVRLETESVLRDALQRVSAPTRLSSQHGGCALRDH